MAFRHRLETQPTSAKLTPQEPVLLNQVRDGLALSTVKAAVSDQRLADERCRRP
jgi:hypothetical protein